MSYALRSPIKFKCGFFVLLLAILPSCNSHKISYVDINRLFESFEYKKKMTAEYNKVKMVRQRLVDSLARDLNIMASMLERDNNMNLETQTAFEKKKKGLYELNRQYEEDNAVLLETYDKQIIAQLNAYIRDYGKKNGETLIVGADSKGSILYGDESIDITDDLLEYVNQRYRGEKP